MQINHHAILCPLLSTGQGGGRPWSNKKDRWPRQAPEPGNLMQHQEAPAGQIILEFVGAGRRSQD